MNLTYILFLYIGGNYWKVTFFKCCFYFAIKKIPDGSVVGSLIIIIFLNKFSSNVCLGGFAGSEPSLSIACAGPDPTTRSRNYSAMAEYYSNV